VKQVLIVDDDPDIRELVRFKLEQLGFQVRSASDGEAGLEAALAQPPDVIVLDVMMPKLSGLEVCRQLRQSPETASTPIILLTAKAQEADVERGFDFGVNDSLVKPFSPRELASRVQAALSRV
jgi:DNA-binding response OmpR family regulator